QEECRAFPGPMAPQSPIHPWRRPLIRGLGARSSVTGSVFPTDMGYIGASGFASEKYFQRTEPALIELRVTPFPPKRRMSQSKTPPSGQRAPAPRADLPAQGLRAPVPATVLEPALLPRSRNAGGRCTTEFQRPRVAQASQDVVSPRGRWVGSLDPAV